MDPGLGAVAGSPLGTALDWISRPARIIPEILTDTDEGIWKNIGDALTGRSSATMSDFLDKYGVFQGDDIFSRAAHAVTGFGLDLAVDPTTYLTMGLGSVGRAGATRFAAKIGAESSLLATEEGMSVIDGVIRNIGKEVLHIAPEATIEAQRKTAFEYIWKQVTSAQSSMAKTGKLEALGAELSIVDADMMGGFLGQGFREGQMEAMKMAEKAADSAHKLIGKFGFRNMSPKLAEEMGVDKAGMQSLIDGMKKAGKFGGRDAYMEAKYAGALQGGWRLSVPGIRTVTPALWGTGGADFSIARRFFSGLSGQMRVMNAVERGVLAPEIGAKALEYATQGGWKRLAEEMPQVSALFGTAHGRLGSAFASASWQIGGITKNLGSAALVRGGGLGDALSADARKMSKIVQSRLVNEAFSVSQGHRSDPLWMKELTEYGGKLDVIGQVSKRADGTMTMPEVQRSIHQLATTAAANSGDDLAVIKALELLPSLEAQQMGADRYYDLLEQSLIARNPKNLDKEIEALAGRRAQAKEIEALMAQHPEIGLAARGYRIVTDQAAQIYNEMGGHISKSSIRTEAMAIINPRNRGDVDKGHALQHGKNYVHADPAMDEINRGAGASIEHVVDGPDGRGYQLVEETVNPAKVPDPEMPGAKGPVLRAVNVLECIHVE